MSNHKNRITQLEKRANEQPVQHIGMIEVIKEYEDGHTETEYETIDDMYERLADRARRIAAGETFPAVQLSPEGETLRDKIMQRIERLAKAQ